MRLVNTDSRCDRCFIAMWNKAGEQCATRTTVWVGLLINHQTPDQRTVYRRQATARIKT